MKTKILASVLVAFFTWTACGVGDVFADLEDIPSTGEFVMMGVAAALVIGAIIVLALSSGDNEKAKNPDDAEDSDEQALAAGVEPGAKVQFRIDPMLTLQMNAVGAGLTVSF